MIPGAFESMKICWQVRFDNNLFEFVDEAFV